MSKVNTNNVTLRYGVQSALGADPTTWKQMEPNTINSYGNELTSVVRRPISPKRGRRKGTVVDRDSAPEFEADATLDSLENFIEGFVYGTFVNSDFKLRDAGAAPEAVASTDDFTVDSVSAALAAKIVFTASQKGTLLFAKGYANAANNGLHLVNATVTALDTAISTASNLVDEAPATTGNEDLQICGVRIITASDLALAVSGSTATLTSTAEISNWATLGLVPGMYVHFGSAGAGGVVQNAFDASGTDDSYGYARIASIAANVLNLDKIDTHLASDAANADAVDILFGRMARNVAVDDADYLTRLYQFEAGYPDLGGAGNDEFEYAIDNQANELVLNIPLTDKATATWGFVGTVTEDIVVAGSRKAGASAAPEPLRTVALNTSADIASITTDLISSASDVCFKSITLTIRNNASPEKCLGTVGASSINTGLFEFDLDGQMLFTSKQIINAINGNATATFATILKNEDGAVAIDIPSMTFEGGDKEYPLDQSVLVNTTGKSFTDSSFGHDVAFTFFATVPTVRT